MELVSGDDSIQDQIMTVAMSPLKNLPAGYRLNPKDEDLVEFYLNGKLHNICGSDVVNCLIPDLNIYNSEPRDLLHLFDELSSIKSNGLECFFFCPANKSRKIVGGKGYWRETGKGREPQETDELKWAKRIFCHDLGTQKNPQKTDWVMHEFRIIGDERLVLCRITEKPKKKLSASFGKKRKSSSTSTNSESQRRVLNHIPTNKSKHQNSYVGSSFCQPQINNGTPQEASFEALLHINADEVPMMMTVSDIINISDDLFAVMAEAPNMNMIEDYTDQPTDIGVEDFSIYEMHYVGLS